jgi:chromosome segregation ATPase
MKNFESFKTLKVKLDEAKGAIPRLEKEIGRVEALQPELDKEAVRAATLEMKDARKKVASSEENKKTIEKLRRELEEGRREIEIIETEYHKLEGAALVDLREHYRPDFEKALSELAESAKRTAAAEEKVRAIQREASAQMDQVSSFSHIVMPPILRLLIEDSGGPEYSLLSRWRRDVKQETGLEL